MNTALHSSFLRLVRLGIGTSKIVRIPDGLEWTRLKALADEQGLSAVVLDGIDRLPAVCRPPQELLLEWIGEVMQNYEGRYAAFEKAIADLAGFYNSHGYKMMLLKGYACSLDWAKPNHRPTGDIDIWLFGQWKEADEELNAWFKVLAETSDQGRAQGSQFKIDTSHHHHTVFNWQGFTIENHYDFINVYHHKSHVALEKILKELGADDSHYVEINGEKVYLPSPNLHALFLLKHAALHFVGTELTFRQVLDWAFFVQKHGKEVDWVWLLGVIEEHGMTPFFNILNAICVGDLGFDAKLFPYNQHLPELKERVVHEIFASVHHKGESENFLIRQVNRFRRWKGNKWKHEICYKESMWSAFWSGVWGHLLKPKSI